MITKLNNPFIKMVTRLSIYLFLFTMACPAFAIDTVGQGIKDTKVSILEELLTVTDIFETIEAQSNYRFVYDSTIEAKNNILSLKANKIAIYEVLKAMSKQARLKFKINNNSIAVSEIPIVEKIIETPIFIEITGVITDNQGVPLPGAAVLEKGTTNGTIADFDGKFSIEVSSDAILVISYIGYTAKEISTAGQNNFRIQLEPNAEQLTEVVVKGYRGSFQRANQAKRRSNKIVDVISAEDIGKLPDPNIAEALQRVTGVQIQRDNASGAFVSIRGLDPTFTKITINGQSQTSARSRAGDTGFNLSVLGSSVASSLEVIKSPTADLEEGGVGGTVNIKKLRPFDIGKTTLTIAAKPVYEVEAEALNPRFEAFFNTLLNDKFGVSFSAFYYDRDFERTRVRAESSPETLDLDGDGTDESFVQDRIRPRLNRDNDKSLTLATTLQYKFSEKANAYVDVTYGRVKGFDTRYDADIRYRTRNVNATGAVANETGFLTTTPLNGFRSLGFGGFSNNTEDQLLSIATGVDLNLSSKTNMVLEYANSYNKKTNDDLPGYGGSLGIGSGGEFDPTPDNEDDTIATLSFGNPEGSGVLFNPVPGVPSFGNLSNYYLGSSTGSSGTLENTEAKEYSVKVDFKTEIGDNFINSIQYGAKFTNRTESEINVRREPIDRTPPTNVSDYLTRITEYNDNDILPGFEYYGVNVRPFAKDAFSDPSKFIRKTGNAGDDLFAERKIFAAYQMVNIGGGEKPYRGNFGIRWVHTKTTTKGFAAFGGDRRLEINTDGSVDGFEEQVSERSYLNALPSINFAYDLTERVIARIGAGRVMRRPEIRELTPYFELGTDRDDLTQEVVINPDDTDGEAGNPNLDPFVANQLDLSLEYYLPGGGILSAGAFYKDVQNFITEDTEVRDVNIIDPSGNPQNLKVNVDTFINGGGATVRGLEVAYQQQFDFLPEPFNGLGTALNYTLTESKSHETGRSLDGTSKNSFNATVYFEKGIWGMRFAHNYRDEFRDGNKFRKPVGLWDASAYVSLMDDKLKLTFNVVNLANKPFKELTLTDDLDRSYNASNFSDYEFAGRQFLFGIIYNIF